MHLFPYLPSIALLAAAIVVLFLPILIEAAVVLALGAVFAAANAGLAGWIGRDHQRQANLHERRRRLTRKWVRPLRAVAERFSRNRRDDDGSSERS